MSEIVTTDYFGQHRLYRFMSRNMFDTLCRAFTAGQPTCVVDDAELNELRQRVRVFRFAKIHNIPQSTAEKILTQL